MELRLLNINVWHGLYARSWWRIEPLETEQEKERRALALIAEVRELDPDIVTIQEAFPQPAFSRRLATELGHEHVCVVSNAGPRVLGAGFPFGVGTGEGSTILARRGLGLRALGTRSLSGFGWTSGLASLQLVPRRAALAAELALGGRRVVVVTAHVRYEFESTDAFLRSWAALRADGLVPGDPPPDVARAIRGGIETRDREIEALASWIEGFAAKGDPVVIGADLNLDDEAPQVARFVERLRLTSALAARGDARRTWDPARNPNIARSAAYALGDGTPKDLGSLLVAHHDRIEQRPDHVLVTPPLGHDAIVAARLALDRARDGVFPSDHFGIHAVLRWD